MMVDIVCRVCGRVEDIWETDSDDYVCGVCCLLSITTKEELQNFLEAEVKGEKIVM